MKLAPEHLSGVKVKVKGSVSGKVIKLAPAPTQPALAADDKFVLLAPWPPLVETL